MNSVEATVAVLAAAPEALYVASLGTATSALREASDDGPHFYFGGAMGCALGFALGVAEHSAERDVICLLGDGELLMSAGSLWSLAGLAPPNLLAIVLDNSAYAITGGQLTVTDGRFARAAAALDSLASAEASTPTDTSARVADTPRPGLIQANVTLDGPPAPDPFVNPDWVLTRFEAACGVPARPDSTPRSP